MIDDFPVERWKVTPWVDLMPGNRSWYLMLGLGKEIVWLNATTLMGSLGLFAVEVRTRCLLACAWQLLISFNAFESNSFCAMDEKMFVR